jgi:hypothetical protein
MIKKDTGGHEPPFELTVISELSNKIDWNSLLNLDNITSRIGI